MKVAVAGSTGRMGRTLIETVLDARDAELGAALEQQANAALGKDAGELVGRPCDIAISDDIEAAVAACDVLIDFTRPEGTLAHVAACRKRGVKLVIGTTGFSDEQKRAIEEAAREIAIAMAPNFSVGVNVTFKLLDVAARALAEGFDFEVIEAHHRHKVDEGLGTRLQEVGDLRPRRHHRRARCFDDRVRGNPRRRRRRRSHGDVPWNRRAHRNHAPLRKPRHLCARRSARRAVHHGQEERALRHAGRAGPPITPSGRT
jgi:4-hydroxy-tetrahydrodipicolinate reductase